MRACSACVTQPAVSALAPGLLSCPLASGASSPLHDTLMMPSPHTPTPARRFPGTILLIGNGTPELLRAMKVDELREYAAQQKITLADTLTLKADILAFLLTKFEESQRK